MRKVIWMSGKKPENMTDEKFEEDLIILAGGIGGELVEFGKLSYMIIGDDEAKKKLDEFKNLE